MVGFTCLFKHEMKGNENNISENLRPARVVGDGEK